MGIFWIISLVLEAIMLAAYAFMGAGFFGSYISRKHRVMLKLGIFSSFMLMFYGIMIYLTYFLAIRYGYYLASIVLLANILVFIGTFYLLSVVNS